MTVKVALKPQVTALQPDDLNYTDMHTSPSDTHSQNNDAPKAELQVIVGHRQTPTSNISGNNNDYNNANDRHEAYFKNESPAKFERGIRFWCIIAGLCVTSLQSSFENSVVVMAGPAIVNDLAMGEEYIWITNAFFLCW